MFKLLAFFAIVALVNAQTWSPPVDDPECRSADPINADVQFLRGPSCDTYRACSHGRSVIKPCPQGNHFNFEKQTCDWPENAGCTNRRRWFAEEAEE